MTDIKFCRDYGYPPAVPFWLVWNEDGRLPAYKHPDRASAEAEAARLASASPGRSFHVLAVMSTLSTNIEVVGNRFDPSRAPSLPVVDVDLEDSPAAAEATAPTGWLPTFLDGPRADESSAADEEPL